jgi:hypothetical protein
MQFVFRNQIVTTINSNDIGVKKQKILWKKFEFIIYFIFKIIINIIFAYFKFKYFLRNIYLKYKIK